MIPKNPQQITVEKHSINLSDLLIHSNGFNPALEMPKEARKILNQLHKSLEIFYQVFHNIEWSSGISQETSRKWSFLSIVCLIVISKSISRELCAAIDQISIGFLSVLCPILSVSVSSGLGLLFLLRSLAPSLIIDSRSQSSYRLFQWDTSTQVFTSCPLHKTPIPKDPPRNPLRRSSRSFQKPQTEFA